MNIQKGETLLKQLRRIVETMSKAGKKPLRVYCTWGQLQALKTELAVLGYHLDPADLNIFKIPIEIAAPGSGLWISCLSDDETKP